MMSEEAVESSKDIFGGRTDGRPLAGYDGTSRISPAEDDVGIGRSEGRPAEAVEVEIEAGGWDWKVRRPVSGQVTSLPSAFW